MVELLARIMTADTVSEAIDLARQDMLRLGATAGTFHVAAPHKSQVGAEVYIAEFGHTEAWMKFYYDRAERQHDPFPDHVMRVASPMTYAQALEQVSLSAEQDRFVARLRSEGIFETMAVPVYGPFDFDTYATFSMGRPFTPADELIIQRTISICEACNRRIALLLEHESVLNFALSDRESEVLKWIAQSKSNTDIATILDISPGTVDTYVRRAFVKLGTNDRIAAVLKGIRLGLIRF